MPLLQQLFFQLCNLRVGAADRKVDGGKVMCFLLCGDFAVLGAPPGAWAGRLVGEVLLYCHSLLRAFCVLLPLPGSMVWYRSQLFQLTATVATSWLSSSFLREYTKDKSPQLELEVSPRGYSSDLDTKCMFTSL